MIPLLEPSITKFEEDMVLDALRSGWVNTVGPYVTKFEEAFSERLGGCRAVAVANGTSGLFLALKAAGVGPGDAVMVPTITFVATVNAIVQLGAYPIFVDCDNSLDLNIDTIDLDLYIDKFRPKAIVPVHIFGKPCNMAAIREICSDKTIIIEDACEALGSTTEIGDCGTIGDLGVFSFSFNKMITAGNGGMVVTNREYYAQKIKYWSTQSKDDSVNYIHKEIGYNLGLPNISAALGYAQLLRLDEFLEAKQKIYSWYTKYLIKAKGCLIETDQYIGQTNHWLVGYSTDKRNKLARVLAENKIQTRPLWMPNHLQEPFKNYPRATNLENAELAWKETINLPSSTNLTEEEVKRICEIILETE